MSTIRLSGAAALLACAVPAPAQQPAPVIVDYLGGIGGDTDLRTIGGEGDPGLPQLRPLVRDKDDVLGYRFFKESLSGGSTVRERSLGAFARECEAKSGRVLDASDLVVKAFQRARIASFIPKDTEVRRWGSWSSVCVAPSGKALGAVAVVVERRELPGSKNPAAMLSLFLPMYRRTAVYAYHPRAVLGVEPELVAQGRVTRSVQEIAAQDEMRRLREQAEEDRKEARNTEFRRKLDVGSDTHCGTVVQVRGPMVEVAGFSGRSTFWSKRTALYPPGAGLCLVAP